MAERQQHPIPVPRIAACMITKNSTATIETALASIRPFVDAVYVYDTGSDDGTAELLEKLNRYDKSYADPETGKYPLSDDEIGSRNLEELTLVPLAPITVQQGEWRQDFAWAREQSFAMVADEYDWLLWLDDDDEIIGGHALRDLAYRSAPEVDGFVFRYDYAFDGDGHCLCTLWRERLLRRQRGWKWEGAVHEVALPVEGPPAYAHVPAEIVRYIHHRPPDRYPPTRNLEILEARALTARDAGRDIDARTLAYLGTENMAQGRLAAAVPFLEDYLSRPAPGPNDERSQVFHKLATCLRLLGQPQAAVHTEMEALKERDDWVENYVGLVETFAVTGQWDRVERWARAAVALPTNQTFLIINPLEVTILPMLRLAEALTHKGDHREAEEWVAKAGQLAPGEIVASRAHLIAQTRQELETVDAILRLRETLVRWDENAKAYHVMENVPYFVAENPAIIKARADQRDMVKHYTDPTEMQRWYRDEPKESTFPWEHIDKVFDIFPRAAGLLEGLKAQEEELGRKPRTLDLGCNDWWIGAALYREGFPVDGVELNTNAYRGALDLVAQEGADGDVTIVQGDLHDAARLLATEWRGPNPPLGRDLMAGGDYSYLTDDERYDAIALFEVFEHVPDIHRTLDVMESLVAPGGRIYISTPNGAFERGNLPNWARVERKGHLRAIPIHELADILSARGEIEMLTETDGGRLSFVSYTPQPRKAAVTFYAGGGWEPWSPVSINTTGLGGSETALVQVATRLAMRGHRVKVYSGAEPGLVGGVLYRPHTAFDPTEEVDLLVVSRLPHVFDNPIGAKSTALWCHDMDYQDQLTPQRASKIDNIVVLSEWQKERFERLYPYLADRLMIVRNGIGLFDPVTGEDRMTDAERPFHERAPRAVYSSSADRGLDTLLELWPRIRARVPDAELHVFYGWDVYDRVALVSPSLRDYKTRVLALVDQAGGEDGGVFMRGRIGQQALAGEMTEARVLAYPTDFLETSCITAMEARAAGLPIVSSELGALPETATGGFLIPWADDETVKTNQTVGYRAVFVAQVVELLTDGDVWEAEHEDVMVGRQALDWSTRIPDWEKLIGLTRPLRVRVAA